MLTGNSGLECKPGVTWKENCNSCFCSPTGIAMCTDIPTCPSPPPAPAKNATNLTELLLIPQTSPLPPQNADPLQSASEAPLQPSTLATPPSQLSSNVSSTELSPPTVPQETSSTLTTTEQPATNSSNGLKFPAS